MDIFLQLILTLGPKITAEYLNELLLCRSNHSVDQYDNPIELAQEILCRLPFTSVNHAVREGFLWEDTYSGYEYWKDLAITTSVKGSD